MKTGVSGAGGSTVTTRLLAEPEASALAPTSDDGSPFAGWLVVMLATLIGVSVLAGLLLMGQTWDGFWFPWPLAVILLVVVALVAGRNQGPAAGPA